MEEGEYSNPLPPPPRGGSSSNSDKSSKSDASAQKNGLSNRDFRRIVMETPRRTVGECMREEGARERERERER